MSASPVVAVHECLCNVPFVASVLETYCVRVQMFLGQVWHNAGTGVGNAFVWPLGAPPRHHRSPGLGAQPTTRVAPAHLCVGPRSIWAPSSTALQGQGSLVGNQREEFPLGVAGCQEQLQNSTSL